MEISRGNVKKILRNDHLLFQGNLQRNFSNSLSRAMLMIANKDETVTAAFFLGNNSTGISCGYAHICKVLVSFYWIYSFSILTYSFT